MNIINIKLGGFMKKFTFSHITFLVAFLSAVTMAQTNFWEKINGPFGDTVGTLNINSSGTIFLETSHGLFRSTDNGVTWALRNLSLGFVSNFVFNSTGAIFATGAGIFRSTDDGINWTQIYDSAIKTIAINDSGHIFIGWGNEVGGGVERSTDNGSSWINTGLAANSYTIAINATGIIFSGGWCSSGGCVFRSTDNGTSWTNTAMPSAYLNTVNKLAISAAGHIFAGTSNQGIYRSTDNGANWIPVTNLFVACFAINTSGHIFAGTFNNGVYRSTDDGANWTTVNAGLQNDSVISIVISPNGTIFATTAGGLFRSVNSTTSVNDFSANAPISFTLYQNYPNPFNPTTIIKYAIPSESNVNIRFYNSLGQTVREANEGNRQPGNYEINFNSSGLASGIYFYSLKAVSVDGKNDFSAGKKMILLK
jgi:photosystem II stability/assembly factor-like uncharacterized protein